MKTTALLLTFAFGAVAVQAQNAVQAWVQRFSGPGNYADVARAVALDTNGNVFVTGYSDSYHSGSHADFTTIKYSNSGAPLWTNQYNGPANENDVAVAIGVDSDGNVVVTGISVGSVSSDDYATTKYSNTGVPLWTNRYNGPANGEDWPRALSTDRDGNVFVTGFSQGDGSSDDYATIKYSSAGVSLWTNRYNGQGNGADHANAVAVDASGNVFVTGTGYATIKYSNAGVPLWTNILGDGDAAAMALNTNGDVFVTGFVSETNGGSHDYLTIKYSNPGVPLWTNRYDGSGHFVDEAVAIGVDMIGGVFVTGISFNGAGTKDYATLAYSSLGVPLWTNLYTEPEDSDGWPRALAVDNNGSVFVTGSTKSTNNYLDYLTIKYSNSGVPLWTNRYNGPPGFHDEGAAIAVNRSGDVFVTGSSQGSGTLGDYDYATIKYSAVEPIPLIFQQLNGQLVLSWTNAVFGLQTAPAITVTFTNISGATSPYTNPIAGAQQFFRLISN
jgi:hypothetical protein